jgi:uncharacterized membrane protein
MVKMKKDTNNWVIGILVLIAVLFLISSLTGSFGTGMTGMMGSGFWFFGWIFMILVTVALVLLIMWLIKQLQKR